MLWFAPACRPAQGVHEKDEVRRDDSFNSFEEVLKIAASLKVDMVLLGGDLFHDNKPSRSTLVRAINLMAKYCLNDNPVNFSILSDQAANFVSGYVRPGAPSRPGQSPGWCCCFWAPPAAAGCSPISVFLSTCSTDSCPPVPQAPSPRCHPRQAEAR